MNKGYYRVLPTSRKKIRCLAESFREFFHLEKEICFPVVEVLEQLAAKGKIEFEVCTPTDMGTKCGETFPEIPLISIREDIYEKAIAGDPFSRSTIAHEVGHWLQHDHLTASFCRSEKDMLYRKIYEDPEWQANCFSGELLVPKKLVHNLNEEEVMNLCQVSRTMARYQLKQYQKEGGNV